MSEFRLSFPACIVAGKHRLATDDLLMLRKFTFPDGIRTCDDVVTVLALQNSCPEKCSEWDAFFVEALTEFIVHYTYPQGSLDEVNAAWLIKTFATDGVVNSVVELELLLHVVEVSAHVPGDLSAFVLDQLRIAVTDEVGAYHLSRPIARKGITRHDVDYVHRVLRRSTNNGGIALSPPEIAVLERIDMEMTAASCHPRWSDLIDAVHIRDMDKEEPRRSRWLRVADNMLRPDTDESLPSSDRFAAA
ncbi:MULTISPECIES: hypothetical protein [unclassified Sinorhizobium]|uniref:hypothetical protein n=1 Tax=unclassified Sinorhizobium TaxID=2613772 RepID=UPI00352315C1